MVSVQFYIEQAPNPITDLSKLADYLHMAGEIGLRPDESIRSSLVGVIKHFTNSEAISPYETSEFLRCSAHVILSYPRNRDIQSLCIRTVGLLLAKDALFEYEKKRLLLQEFGTLTDLVHIIRYALEYAPHYTFQMPVARIMYTMANLMKARIAKVNPPYVIGDSLEYVTGTLEYYAVLPGEIETSREDFLPDIFLSQLEYRMSFYSTL
jgi:hypothetical protein